MNEIPVTKDPPGTHESVDRELENSSQDIWPEGSGRIVHDGQHGEVTCADCGIILHDDASDRGPEWRVYDDDGT